MLRIKLFFDNVYYYRLFLSLGCKRLAIASLRKAFISLWKGQ